MTKKRCAHCGRRTGVTMAQVRQAAGLAGRLPHSPLRVKGRAVPLCEAAAQGARAQRRAVTA